MGWSEAENKNVAINVPIRWGKPFKTMEAALRCQIPNLRLFAALMRSGDLRRKWQRPLMNTLNKRAEQSCGEVLGCQPDERPPKRARSSRIMSVKSASNFRPL